LPATSQDRLGPGAATNSIEQAERLFEKIPAYCTVFGGSVAPYSSSVMTLPAPAKLGFG